MTVFDRQQQLAIDTTGTNILVSASAGAGKTSVLVGRLTKRVVKDHIPLSRILALTFTEAAAAEMKTRLAFSLHQVYAVSKDDAEKEWLGQQLAGLEAASITTIDAYCLTIVQKYFAVIGLDPAMTENIISEGVGRILRQQAFNQVYGQLSRTDPDQALMMAEYFNARSEDYENLKTAIDDINTTAQAALDPAAWYSQAAASYKPVSQLKQLPVETQQLFYQHLYNRLGEIIDLLDQMKNFVRDDAKLDEATFKAKANAAVYSQQCLQQGDYDAYCVSLEALLATKTSTNDKNTEYKAVRGKMNRNCNSLLADSYSSALLVKDHNGLDELCRALVQLAADTYQNFQLLKRKQLAMDFADMERFAYDILLANDKTVARIIADSFDEITIDEFQDTSVLQNAIIEAIAKPDNVFRVGDVKQSIYRFRQAKPELMRSLMTADSTLSITLQHNYRSQESIIEFSNELFDRLMNVEGIANRYDAADHVEIGVDSQSQDEYVPVEFLMLSADDSSPDETAESESEEPENQDDLTASHYKAELVAGKIIELMQQDHSLGFKSFAVLTRSHQDKRYLRYAFDKYGIPYNIDTRSGFYNSDLCCIVNALVNLMINGHDTIAMLAVLTSSLYRLTDDQLARLLIDYKSVTAGVSKEYSYVYQDIASLRSTVRQHGITAMLTKLGQLNGFYNSLDVSQKANFDYLFEMVSSQSFDSLASFKQILEAGQDERSSEATSIGSDDDVVTVTTIHQAKGLQYPVVFVWSSIRNFNMNKRNKLIVDDQLGIGLSQLTLPYREKRTTLQRMALEEKDDQEDLAEYVRLLYVAVTRAEKQLYFVGIEPKDFGIQRQGRPVDMALLQSRKGISGLVLNALFSDDLLTVEPQKPEVLAALAPLAVSYDDQLPQFDQPVSVLKPVQTPSETELKFLPGLDPDASAGGSRYGTMMHQAVESLPDRPWTVADMTDLPLQPADKEKLLVFAGSDLYKQALTMTIHKEYPFYVETESQRFIGTMDFVAIGAKDIILVDFKTDSATEKEISQRYSDQLNTYRQALQLLYPDHDIKVYAWSFHNGTAIEITA